MSNTQEIVQKFLSYLTTQGISPNSLKFYKSDINHFLNYSRSAFEINSFKVAEYINLSRAKYPLSTINRRLSTLRKYSKFMQDTGLASSDFMKNVSNIDKSANTIMSNSSNLTEIEKFDNYLIQQNISKNTRKVYLSDINKFLSWQKVTEGGAKEYLNEHQIGLSRSAFDRIVSSLKKFYEYKGGKFPKTISVPRQAPYAVIQRLILSKLDTKERLQNRIHKLFFARPKWYTQYHNYPLASYLHFAVLVIFCAISGYALYDQIYHTPYGAQAYPATAEVPNRFLSFQGRLTNEFGNPITGATNVVFKLYAASSGGTALWETSPACSIDPDGDGIFSTLLGSSCGGAIASSVFSENADIWLGVTVDTDAEAIPRIQIATVAYALNSETLQGFPLGTGVSTVPYIDSTGKLAIAVASPTIESSSGTFGVVGQAMTISTADTTNGSISINPDGTGTLNLNFEGTTAGGSANGFINAVNANITSGALYGGTVASAATGFNFIDFKAGVTPASKFSVSAVGSTTMAGDLTISGDDLFMATNTANYFLMADGQNYNPTSPADVRTGLGLTAGGTGDIWVEKAGDTMTGPLTIDGSSNAIQLVVQANGTQTANLQEWQNSSAAPLVTIGPTGVLTLPNSNTIAGVTNFTQFSGGVSVGAGTSYYLNSSGVLSATDITTTGEVGIGGTAPTASWLDLAAATTGKAQVNLTSSAGTDVSSPGTGDLWYNGTNLYFYNGSANKDLLSPTVTPAWSSLTNPTDNLTLAHGTHATTMGWTGTGALNAWTMNNINNAASGTQNFVTINQAVSTGSDATDNLFLIQQLDTTTSGTTGITNALKIDVAANSGMTNALTITNSAGNLTTGINIADTAGGTLTTGIALSGTITTGIDMGNTIIANIGNVGTDFNANGGLTLAENLVIQGTTGLTFNTGAGGDITFANGEKIDNDANGTIAVTGNLSTSGTFTLPNSNTITGVTNYSQFSGGISVGGGTTYYINSSGVLSASDITTAGEVGIGVATPTTAWADLAAATTGKAQINLTSSATTNVATPNDGDLWYNGTNLYFYNGTLNKDLLAGSETAGQWTLSTTTLHPILATTDIAVGVASNTLVAPFSVDESENTVRIGEGSNSNGKLNMYASGGQTGSIAYTTSDEWNFTDGGINLDSYLDLDSTSATAFTLGDGTYNYFTYDGSTDAADTLFTMNSASSGISTGSLFSMLADTITSGIGATLSVDALTEGTGLLIDNAANTLTTGTLLQIQSTATSLTTATDGFLGYYNWNPGSASTATGDLLRLNIGQYGNVSNLLNITDNGSTLFRVSESQVESAVPHAFTAAGDVAIAYDLVFTNQTASNIQSYGPLTVASGESFENNNMTFKTYGTGDFIFSGGNIQVALDNEASRNYALCVAADDGGATPGTTLQEIDDCDSAVTADYAEIYPTENGVDYAEIVAVSSKTVNAKKVDGNIIIEGEYVDISKLKKASSENQDDVIGITSNNYGDFTSAGHDVIDDSDHPLPVALSGRVPVKISSSSPAIKIGDPITSSNEAGKGTKSQKPGRIIGIALEDWNPLTGKDKITVFINNSWYTNNEFYAEANDLKFASTQTEFWLADVTGNLIDKIAKFREIVATKIKTDSIETNIISPIANSDLIIDLDPEGANGSSKLAIKGRNNQEVASIDASGKLTADSIQTTDATISGILYADDIQSKKLEDIENLLREVESNQNLLATAEKWETNTATDSANFKEVITNNLFVMGESAVTTLLASESVSLGSDFILQSLDTSINTVSNSLKLQSLALAPVEIMAGRFKIDTEGNVKIVGDLDVAGDISSQRIVIAESSTDENSATSSAGILQGDIQTNATAGKALLAADITEVRLINSKVNENTLIYITPLSSTQNKVLYIKSKEEGAFTVGFTESIDANVEFNWWIIELKQEEQI